MDIDMRSSNVSGIIFLLHTAPAPKKTLTVSPPLAMSSLADKPRKLTFMKDYHLSGRQRRLPEHLYENVMRTKLLRVVCNQPYVLQTFPSP
jgi:hypothetical protein